MFAHIRNLSEKQEHLLKQIDMKDLEEDKIVMFQKRYRQSHPHSKLRQSIYFCLFAFLQILLDSLHHFLCIAANQRTIGILGRFGASGTFRCILIALFGRIERVVADHIGPLCMGLGQKTQAIRLEYDILGDQKLLATISLFIAVRLSNGRIWKLW